MKIQAINKQNINMLSKEIISALDEVSEKYGVKIEINGGKFGVVDATLKMQISVKETLSGESAEEAKFKKSAQYYGLKAEDYNRVFEFSGTKYCLIGINSRSYKYPILAKNAKTGKLIKFQKSAVLGALGIN